MADPIIKKLNTRIALRYDTYENWSTLNPVLALGEVAVVRIDKNTMGNTDHKPLNTPPAIAMKVGDGTTPFNGLPYAQAVAGDVHAWAKASEKPSYEAEDIEMVRGAVEAVLNDTEIDVHDTDTYYQITTNKVDGKHKVVFEAYKKNGERDQAKDVTLDWSDLDTEIGTLKTNLNTLETITMPGAIQKAIETLDGLQATGEGKFVVEVTQTDGNVQATMGNITKDDISNLIGLEDLTDFEAYDDRVGALETTLGHVNLGAQNVPVGDANKIATDKSVQETIEGALDELDYADSQATLDANAGANGEYVVSVTQEGGAIAVTKSTLTSSKITDWETAVTQKLDAKANKADFFYSTNEATTALNYIVRKDDIATLAGAMHFRDEVDSDPTKWATPSVNPDVAGEPPYVSGDIVILKNSTQEFVFNGTKWIELGNEGIHATNTQLDALREDIMGDGTDAKPGAINAAVKVLEQKHDDFVDDTYGKFVEDYNTYVAAMQQQIEGMKLADAEITGDGKFITIVTQEDGKISAARAVIETTDLPDNIPQSKIAGLEKDFTDIQDIFDAANDGEGITATGYLATDVTVQTAIENYDEGLRGALAEDENLKSAPLHKVALTGNFLDMEDMAEDSADYLFLNCGNASNFSRA